MILYLVRHGETAHNRDGLGLGREDVPLTAHGEAQAGQVAEALADKPLGAVYSSPLARSARVAELIAERHGMAVEVRPELIEMDVGETEGMALAAIRERYPEFLQQWAGQEGHLARMPGGESLDDVAARLLGFLAGVASGPGEAAAVVSHNFVLKVLLGELLGVGAARFRAISVDLASISAVRLRDGRASVLFTNDRCHLAPLEPTAREG